MIVRCVKCDTKFRFDDNLVTDDGVWVRCTRCQHVFFQDTVGDTTGFLKETRIVSPEEEKAPVKPETVYLPDMAAVKEVVGPDTEKEAADLDISPDTIRKKEDEFLLSRVEKIREAMEEKEGEFDLAVKEFDHLEDLAAEPSAAEPGEAPPEPTAPEKKMGALGKFFAYLFLLLIIFLLLGAVYFWLFPQARKQAAEFLVPYFPKVARMAKDQIQQDQAAGRVILQDVRQRFVNNLLMGNLRVVEGAAVNAAKYPLTRIQVRGRLYDAGGAVLGERVSFCGNVLSDAELATSTEDDIQRKLAQPLGSNVSNDRITPQGQIPFMIVFIHDQPAVAKVTVMAAGAEKLLE
jgi:predicted Zn finger-like uncharacterized protein